MPRLGVYQQSYQQQQQQQQQLWWRQQVNTSKFACSKALHMRTIGDLFEKTIHLVWPFCVLFFCLATYSLLYHRSATNNGVAWRTGETYRLNVEGTQRRHGSSGSSRSRSRTSQSKSSGSVISITSGSSRILDGHRPTTQAEHLHLDPKETSAGPLQKMDSERGHDDQINTAEANRHADQVSLNY